MKWSVAADFFSGSNDIWLDDFIEDPRLEFQKVVSEAAQEDWHHQKSMRTSVGRWRAHLAHARKALNTEADGVITCFPQLAVMAGLQKRIRRSRRPLVAYNFNIGTLVTGARQKLARFAAGGIDRFVVHSPSEVALYADYLGLPEDRFRFIPVQRGALPMARRENTTAPFILAMGSAQRDYGTLVEALRNLQLPTVIVTRKDIADGLPKQPWIEYRHGLSERACLELLSQARLSVTPVSNMETASGQVTFVNALRMGVATIATRCPGTDGYIEHARTGRLVPPFDPDALEGEIRALWQDDAAREALARAGADEAEARFSDEATSSQLRDILVEFC